MQENTLTLLNKLAEQILLASQKNLQAPSAALSINKLFSHKDHLNIAHDLNEAQRTLKLLTNETIRKGLDDQKRLYLDKASATMEVATQTLIKLITSLSESQQK